MGRSSGVEYVKPTSVEEAIEELDAYEGSLPIAGGTDLLVQMREGKCRPRRLVDLASVQELGTLSVSPERVIIGATATVAEIAETLKPLAPLSALAQAASLLGTPQVRNLATIGGNICNASPAAELVGPLIALGASALIRGVNGERFIPLEEMFLGPGETVLGKAEVLTAIDMDLPPPGTVSAYGRQARSRVDLATVGVSVRLTLEGRYCKEARIVLSAVAPIPVRARKAEEVLVDRELTWASIQEAALLAATETSPIDDVRASAEYRRILAEVLTRRTLTSLMPRTGGGQSREIPG